MADGTRLQLVFTDLHRVWQDLLGPAERSGRVFVPHDAVLDAGTPVELRVVIEDRAELTVPAVVELTRRPSLRFSRGVFLSLGPEALARILATAGEEAAGEPSLGRAVRRYPLRWAVRFRTPALFKPLLTLDISLEGMHVQMPERVAKGHVVELTLFAPGGEELDLRGEVQWTSELTDRVGIRFLHEDDGGKTVLRRLIEHAAHEGRQCSGAVLVVGVGPDADGLEAALSAAWPDAVVRLPAAQALAEIRRSRPRLVLLPSGASAGPIATSLKLDAELRAIDVLVYGRGPDLEREAGGLHAAGSIPLPATAGEVVGAVERFVPRSDRWAEASERPAGA